MCPNRTHKWGDFMAIGNWGKEIKFSVNADKMFTFSDFKRSYSGRWSKHNIQSKRPKKEFNGPDETSVSLTIILDAKHGVKPWKILQKIKKAVAKGETNYLYIGGKKVTKKKVYIESASETWAEIWNKGELVRAKVDITFSEY